MAVIKAVSSKAGIGHAIDYVTKKEKTEEKLVSGLHCEPETVKEEMQATKELWGKTDGRTYKHYVQSYHEDEEITPEQAHKNAVELAEHTKAWKGHEVLIATHIDKGHIHTHFIVNSVNYENGHKLQWSKHDLKDLSMIFQFLKVYQNNIAVISKINCSLSVRRKRCKNVLIRLAVKARGSEV